MDIQRASPPQRVHITRPSLWSRSAGTDFWIPGHADTVGIAADELLTDYGWTTTGLSYATSTGGDFLSSADVGTPEAIILGADTDLLQSPQVFGDYSHGLMAAGILGYMPTKLTVEVYAAFTTSSGNESRTGFGLVKDGGTAGVDDHANAWIFAGTTFTCRHPADSDGGSSKNTAYHRFQIVQSVGTTAAIEWFVDGTSQGTLNAATDRYPASFGAYTSTTNRLAIPWVHIWYS